MSPTVKMRPRGMWERTWMLGLPSWPGGCMPGGVCALASADPTKVVRTSPQPEIVRNDIGTPWDVDLAVNTEESAAGDEGPQTFRKLSLDNKAGRSEDEMRARGYDRSASGHTGCRCLSAITVGRSAADWSPAPLDLAGSPASFHSRSRGRRGVVRSVSGRRALGRAGDAPSRDRDPTRQTFHCHRHRWTLPVFAQSDLPRIGRPGGRHFA